jgi:hypothetical protein
VTTVARIWRSGHGSGLVLSDSRGRPAILRPGNILAGRDTVQLASETTVAGRSTELRHSSPCAERYVCQASKHLAALRSRPSARLRSHRMDLLWRTPLSPAHRAWRRRRDVHPLSLPAPPGAACPGDLSLPALLPLPPSLGVAREPDVASGQTLLVWPVGLVVQLFGGEQLPVGRGHGHED